jgi:hypothetical protein
MWEGFGILGIRNGIPVCNVRSTFHSWRCDEPGKNGYREKWDCHEMLHRHSENLFTKIFHHK